jgi:hypothetical protein
MMALDNAYPAPSNNLEDLPQWESFFTGLSANGVVPTYGSHFSPSISSPGRTVTIATGAAMIRGFFARGTTTTTTSVPAADTQNRIDRLVLRLDRSAVAAADWIKPHIITGTPAASPQIPAITTSTSTSGVWDLTVCRWTSRSNGALDTLVDERITLSPTTLVFRSDARPTPSPADFCFGWEWNTGKVLYWDTNTSAWAGLSDDTGWVDLTMNGANGSSWTNNNISRIRKRNGVVHLRVSIKRGSSALATSVDGGSVPIVIPSAFWPSVDEVSDGYHSRSPFGMRVETDGKVRITPLQDDIPAGRTIQASITYLTD